MKLLKHLKGVIWDRCVLVLLSCRRLIISYRNCTCRRSGTISSRIRVDVSINSVRRVHFNQVTFSDHGFCRHQFLRNPSLQPTIRWDNTFDIWYWLVNCRVLTWCNSLSSMLWWDNTFTIIRVILTYWLWRGWVVLVKFEEFLGCHNNDFVLFLYFLLFFFSYFIRFFWSPLINIIENWRFLIRRLFVLCLGILFFIFWYRLNRINRVIFLMNII